MRRPPAAADPPRWCSSSSPSALRGDQFGVALQVQRPAVARADAVARAFPAGAMAVEVAMLELDPRPLGRLGDEADLDLAGLVRIGLDLPPRADVPAEHETIRRLEGE